MATTVDEWKVTTFLSNTFMLAQQKDSRFRSHCDVIGGVTGERVVPDEIVGGASKYRKRTSRAEPTPAGEVTMYRRSVYPGNFDWYSPLRDKIDDFEMIMNPDNAYVQAGSAEVSRAWDDLIIGSNSGFAATSQNPDFYGTGLFGNSYAGHSGTDPVALPTTAWSAATAANKADAYVIDEDYSGTTEGLTPQKLLAVQQVFEAREVLQPGDRIKIAVDSIQRRKLKENILVINKDYTNQMVLDSGEITQWGKFDFIQTERLPWDDANTINLPCWLQRYLVLVTWQDVNGGVIQRTDRSNAWQLYFDWTASAYRRHEEGFCVIKAAG